MQDQPSPESTHIDQAQPPTSLEPPHHKRHVRSIQSLLLAQSESTSSSSQEIASALLTAYKTSATNISLEPTQWLIFLALQLCSHAVAGLRPSSLEAVLEQHRKSTLQVLDIGLFKRYVGLTLHYFSLLAGVHVETSVSQQDQANQPVSQPTIDPLRIWTGLLGGPSVFASSTMYHSASLPSLQADQGQAADGPAWENLVGLQATRSRIREAYTRCAYHLSESSQVWQLYLDFELALLQSGKLEASAQLEEVKQAYLARLRVPHNTIDATFQEFSLFITNHLPVESYEDEMSSANKLYASSKQHYMARERYEDRLSSLAAYQASNPSAARDSSSFTSYWKPYLRWQSYRVQKALGGKDKAAAQTEQGLASALYERAIAAYGTYPPASAEQEAWESAPATKEWNQQWAKSIKAAKRTGSWTQTETDAKQRFADRLSTAEAIWSDYTAVLLLPTKPEISLVLDVCERWIHVLPTSAIAYVTYLRQLCRFGRPKQMVEGIFGRIMAPDAARLPGSDTVELLVARIDCERHFASQELALTSAEGLDVDPATNMDKFMEVYALISYALTQMASSHPTKRDASFRLERYAVDWVERAVNALGGPDSEAGAGLNDLAESVWQNLVKTQSQNMRVYREAAAYWIRHNDAKKARNWFKGGITKFEKMVANAKRSGAEVENAGLEQLLEEWVQFEHQRGSMEDIELALGKAKQERERMWQAWYASYAAQQGKQQAQYSQQQSGQEDGQAMEDVDMAGPSASATLDAQPIAEPAVSSKRKTEVAVMDSTDAISRDTHLNDAVDSPKKTKLEETKEPTRDRENTSVLLAGLPSDTMVGTIRSFLRDCGQILEITGPRPDGPETTAALVEFTDRSGASSALTRDMKKIGDHVISIHLGWKSTLFVTNYPEEWEDQDVRSLFGKYGAIFDVRWPSRKFVTTRRFCYVQFTTPEAAQASLVCDKLEMTPTCTLQVALSDPSRRKARTDTHNNERELFVLNLPRPVSEEELRTTFSSFGGTVTGIRIPTHPDGNQKGIAYIDFATTLDAQKAMRELNSTKIRHKVISVTQPQNKGGHGAVPAVVSNRAQRRAEAAIERKSRSVRIGGVPKEAQEALIQQSVQHVLGHGSVQRVMWTPGDESGQAVIEFTDVNTAGKALLAQGLQYQGQGELTIISGELEYKPSAGGSTTFVPRASRGRGRGGFSRPTSQRQPQAMDQDPLPQPKGQDAFRNMLRRP